MISKILAVGLGGMLGTLGRVALHLTVEKYFKGHFPLATLVINVTGCFAFGWAWSFSEKRMLLDTNFRLFVMVGFLAAFTTFSTYAFQTFELFAQSRPFLAGLNLLGHNGLGILALMLGAAIGSR